MLYGLMMEEINFFQSRIFYSCYPRHRRHKLLPAVPLGAEYFPALACQVVIASASLVRFFYPSALDPAPLFQAIQEWIQ